MKEWARLKGRTPDSVGSTYQGSPEQIREHEKRHGYDKPWGPNGVTHIARAKDQKIKDLKWGKQIFTYRGTEVAHLADTNVPVSRTLLPS